jgi:hypothetical protein
MERQELKQTVARPACRELALLKGLDRGLSSAIARRVKSGFRAIVAVRRERILAGKSAARSEALPKRQ